MSRAVDMAPRRKPPVIRTDPNKPGAGFRDRKRERNDTTATSSPVPSTKVPASKVPITSAKVSVLRLPAASEPAAVLPPGHQVQSPGPTRAGTGAEKPVPETPSRSERAAADPSVAKTGGDGSSAKVLVFPGVPRRRRRRNLWITAAAVAALIAVVMAAVMFSPLLALKTITVDGNKLATTQAIQAALAPLMDKPLPQIDQAQVQKLLVPLQQVRSVSVEARPPSSLLVHIVEREPVALLKTDQQYIMVDPDGVQLGGTPDPAAIALPLIDGGTAAIGKETFKAMTAVLAALPQSVLGKLQHASAASPDAVELTLNDGKTIVWGNASEKELKAKVLEALLNAPVPSPAAGKPAPAPVQVYDVSTPRHPVTR